MNPSTMRPCAMNPAGARYPSIMPQMPARFHAVRRSGLRGPAIFFSWADCEALIHQTVKPVEYQAFYDIASALHYINAPFQNNMVVQDASTRMNQEPHRWENGSFQSQQHSATKTVLGAAAGTSKHGNVQIKAQMQHPPSYFPSQATNSVYDRRHFQPSTTYSLTTRNKHDGQRGSVRTHSYSEPTVDYSKLARTGATVMIERATMVNPHTAVGTGQRLEREAIWENRFRELRAYRARYGSTKVPISSDKALCRWVSIQRTEYRHLREGKPTKMTPTRIEKLNSIGFIWRIKDLAFVNWEHRFTQLVAYKEKNGHCNVRQHSRDKTAPYGLREFVMSMRRDYKLAASGSNEATISQKQIKMLNSIGFCWKLEETVGVGIGNLARDAIDGPLSVTGSR